MCGIAGMALAPGADIHPPGRQVPEILERMRAALAHRGPDGSGTRISSTAALAQTRLAIIDLETGNQPLIAGDGTAEDIALVANGEIYNYRELQKDLTGAPLKTRSDCEPPLYLYGRDGAGFAGSLRGMYAIALENPQTEEMVLTRDPFGIKPLYYAETSRGVLFASEPRALLASGLISPALNRDRALELLQVQFTMGRETAYRGIQRVLPGETLTLHGGRITGRSRQAALTAPGTEGLDARGLKQADALYELDRLLNETVDLHQRSDVPYGMFLSGGVDSSVLLAMMNRLNAEPVEAFTIGFDSTTVHDERDHARALAKTVGARHREITFGEDDFWTLLPRVALALDDPTADYAAVPTYKLAAAVKDAGLKVVLTGEGGDEMFAGYGRYRRAVRPRLLGGRAMRLTGTLDGLGILRDDLKDLAGHWRDGITETETTAAAAGWTGLRHAQATDITDWLPNDLLLKVDRCLMAHGVEGRVPFVDRKLANFAFHLPDRLKVHHRRGKWLLRKWLETALPESKPFSKKRGFTVPVADWIGAQGDVLGPLVASSAGIQELCKSDAVETLFKHGSAKTGFACWTLLFYALWHRIHMEGQPPDGDAFEVLAA